MLAVRVAPIDKVIQQYYQTLADSQTKALNTKGTVIVMVGYTREKQAVELTCKYTYIHMHAHAPPHSVSVSLLPHSVIQANDLPPVSIGNSCHAYLKMGLLVPDKDFTTAVRYKSRVYERSLSPKLQDDLYLL